MDLKMPEGVFSWWLHSLTRSFNSTSHHPNIHWQLFNNFLSNFQPSTFLLLQPFASDICLPPSSLNPVAPTSESSPASLLPMLRHMHEVLAPPLSGFTEISHSGYVYLVTEKLDSSNRYKRCWMVQHPSSHTQFPSQLETHTSNKPFKNVSHQCHPSS